MSKNPYQKYKTTAVQSASKEKLLLMMYEGAIRFAKRAREGFEQNDLASRNANIGRVYDIVMELNNTLDHKVGGELSENLEGLYMFMTDQLTKSTIEHDKEALESVIRLLETLYEGWVQAVEQLKTGELKEAK